MDYMLRYIPIHGWITRGFGFFSTPNFRWNISTAPFGSMECFTLLKIRVCHGCFGLFDVRQPKEVPLSLVVSKLFPCFGLFFCIRTALLYGFSSVWWIIIDDSNFFFHSCMQVRYTFVKGNLELQMPPLFSIVIQVLFLTRPILVQNGSLQVA